MNRHEVIVYNSPAQAFWWDHPEYIVNFFYIIGALIVLFIIYRFISSHIEKRKRYRLNRW